MVLYDIKLKIFQCLKMQQRGAQRAQEMVAELKFAMLFRASIVVRYPSHQTTVVAQVRLILF